jgi:nucleotide-binding universal stress UspA family protein
MRTILLPTDFSQNSLKAIKYGIDLLRNEECRFILVNAYMSPQAGVSMLVSLNDVLGEQSAKDLKRLKESLEADYFSSVLDIEVVSEYGYVPVVIESTAKKFGCDLIVMGTKGATGLKGIIIGSNTAAAIKNTHYPILAIPENADFHQTHKVALAWDQSPELDNSIYDPLIWLSQISNAKVLVVNVSEDEHSEDPSYAELDEVLKQVDHEVHYEKSAQVAEGIEHFVNDNNVDIVTVIPHVHGFFEKIFKPSITKQLCLHTDIPILILPEVSGAGIDNGHINHARGSRTS